MCDLYPEVRPQLAAFTEQDFWTAPDIWEERIEPKRDHVLDYLDGRIPSV